uniref:ATP synthase complex subunit 8 n=1 Tax=Labracinus cyclophthalmus TaxID=270574 RepID=A2VCC1_9TELE|nr:ATP synthase F0 subunit 8 [Labracinus cyclophthalmus]BAF46783.1 ATPase subunit 8 [Labracinus cyclophthalmus]BBU25869.1 ATPase subunit 8 [Labracinus cyclophthalmus]
MPQLDPTPWFAIFIFSWAVFLTVLPPKIASHTFPNDPAPQGTTKPTTQPWNWPWP